MAPFQHSRVCFLLWLLLILPFTVTSQSNRNISLGSSLATESKSLWLSPSGEFGFGFQQITNNSYLVAVVFDKIPERTVVWSANRNNLVPGGSKIELTTDGRLVLTDPSGRQIWTPNSDGRRASHAAMLDTGNFVLAANDSSSSLWESFQEPTDTLLPSQTLERGSQLVAKYSKSNYSEGRFKFVLQSDGNLLMYTTHYPETRSSIRYWSAADSSPSTTPPGDRVVFKFNQSAGFLDLVSSNGTAVFSVFDSGGSSQDFYQRVTLDHDGVLRYYEYPKTNYDNSTDVHMWNSIYFKPPNICNAITGDMGSGACGFNSYCELVNDQYPKCRCPPGHSFQDPSDESKGCNPEFAPQDCHLEEESNGAFDLVPMPKVNWPFYDYEYFQTYTEDMCRESCMSDCRCALVVVGETGCWKKKSPLSNGRVEVDMTGKSLIKVRRSDHSTTSSQPPAYSFPNGKNKTGKALIIIGSVLLASSAFVIFLSATIFLLLSTKKKKRNKDSGGRVVLDGQMDWLSRNLQSFSYCQLERATRGFKEVLGSGASGTVYRGVLPNQQLIAVKKLDQTTVSEIQDQEFETEVKIIGGTNHRNLVKLVGFCNEGLHRVLVYEFMSNGSLANLLFGGGGHSRPSWYTRTEIACAVGRGLAYLHEECSTQIIHCDIKPQNVLLDESMTAKISDFGVSKLLKVNQTRTMTRIRGTRGYVAPEWFRNMPVTAKVDVYSLGILLLELVCCRNKLEPEAANEAEVVLADWAYECYSEGQLWRLVENDSEAMANMEKVERFVKIALWCIQNDPSFRPGMKKIVHMLEGSVDVPAPLDSESFISSI